MSNGNASPLGYRIVFITVVASALCWAAYTQHAWEDYYITYRASKNLAMGHGLTFTVGERIHSFTSPLGVLLPALSFLLTGNSSDTAALWIFRVMSASALGGAAALLWSIARRHFASAAGLLVVLFAAESKIIDFSINGMETGFLLLFSAWTLALLLQPPKHFALLLGLAWAGLMWTRPDSFVYIAALGGAVLLFRPPIPRLRLLGILLAAGGITTLVYAPWLLWAWHYYGSPVPHTVTAKGLFNPHVDLPFLWQGLKAFPREMLRGIPALPTGTFMPAYSNHSGWPAFLDTSYHALALGLATVWLIPGINRVARVGSAVFCAGQLYLCLFVHFPVPWYLPPPALFAFVALASLLDQAWRWAGLRRPGLGRWFRLMVGGAAVLLVATELAVSAAAAFSLKQQQQIIEVQQRTQIGRWLKAHARSPQDSVFLEPLGYIGFYSELKMYDYPGLSSAEVVEARKWAGSPEYPDCWAALIGQLSPDWLVLRAHEVASIEQQGPGLLERNYDLSHRFDVRPAVQAIPRMAGRGYLMHDAYFEVYRRKSYPASRAGHTIRGIRRLGASAFTQIESWGQPAYDSGDNVITLPPSRLSLPRPQVRGWITGEFGIFEDAYQNPAQATDGAEFRIEAVDGRGGRKILWQRLINPLEIATDRGRQTLSVPIPTGDAGTLEFIISPGPKSNTAYDWTYWSGLAIELAR